MGTIKISYSRGQHIIITHHDGKFSFQSRRWELIDKVKHLSVEANPHLADLCNPDGSWNLDAVREEIERQA